MRQMKIVIKCEGLCVRTRDLGMGLSILNRIAAHGIMKHTFIPNALLTKAIKVIDHASSAGAMAKKLLQKTKENFTMPEFAPTDEVKAVATTKSAKPRKSPKMVNSWTVEEDKLVCDMLGKPVSKVINRATLKQRHTKHAIKTRFSLWKNRKYSRVNSDRAKLMEAYLSGEKVETPVADINKHVPTPVVDSMERKASKNGHFAWTDADIKLLKENVTTPIKELMKLFPDRTRSALLGKRTKVKKSVGMTSMKRVTTWSEEEVEAVKLNMDMKPKELAAMPWLKDKTVNQISQQKHYLKKKQNAS